MYDLEYLRQFHNEIMLSSMKEKGYTIEYVTAEYSPGTLRPTQTEQEIRAKKRCVASKGITTIAVYSRMNDETQQAADTMLKSINVDELAKLSCEEFSDAMANLYADLDFCHPFVDGNSRTLRAFIADVANESEFKVDWKRFDNSKEAQEELYAARDVEVNSIALGCMYVGRLKKAVEDSINVLQQDFKSLAEIFDEITQPKDRTHELNRDSGIELD